MRLGRASLVNRMTTTFPSLPKEGTAKVIRSENSRIRIPFRCHPLAKGNPDRLIVEKARSVVRSPIRSSRDSFMVTIHSTVQLMSTTVVRCSLDGCLEPAAYKVAAYWSDGSFTELKTYGFACCDHLGPVFRNAEARHSRAARNEGETVEEIAIYKFEQGKRDRHLQRLWGLEENYRS